MNRISILWEYSFANIQRELNILQTGGMDIGIVQFSQAFF